MKIVFATLLVMALGTAAPAQQTSGEASNADWRTPAERGDYRTTPRYDETIAYVRRVAAAAPGKVRVEVFGKTGEGRELVDVVSRGAASSTPRPCIVPAARSCSSRMRFTPVRWTAKTRAWRCCAIW